MTVRPSVGAPDPQPAFQHLQTLVRQWRDLGRITTTAGLKPAMQSLEQGFSEQRYGFDTFRDFALAAETAGLIRVMRLSNGHTLLGLPDETSESLEQVASMSRASESKVGPPTAAAEVDGRALKPDVWSVFIDWRADHRRVWDRHTRRAFMFPVDEDGRPCWESNAQRFVDVPAVTFGQQVAWMHEWVDTLPEPSRGHLKRSLADSAPKGEFRRELTRLGMSAQWRTVLRQKVHGHVADWAAREQVPLVDVTDLRQPDTARPTARNVSGAATTAAGPPPAAQPAPGSTAVVRSPGGTPAVTPAVTEPPAYDVERLRHLVHRAVDRMSLAELAALPIRAEHLLLDA